MGDVTVCALVVDAGIGARFVVHGAEDVRKAVERLFRRRGPVASAIISWGRSDAPIRCELCKGGAQCETEMVRTGRPVLRDALASLRQA